MTKTIEELKEMAIKQFNIQLKLMKILPTLNFTEAMDFQTWYVNHPLNIEILSRSQKSSNLKK